MKGFAYLGEGKTGWIDKDDPVASGADAVIRPLAVAPCSSDVHNVEMDILTPGRILGHEGVGEVVAVGEAVRDFFPGDRVLIPPITPDWSSLPAQKGVPQHCHGLLTGNLLSNAEDGLFAPLCRIRDADANLALLPEKMHPVAALLAADMMNTGLYGCELADISFGDTVVVLGVGPVGLMAVAGARLRGAGRIIAIGSRPVCLRTARLYGATDCINYREEDPVKAVYTLTEKQGADCCVCAGGGEDALGQCVSMVRWGGRVANVNYFSTRGDLSINAVRWGFGMGNKSITGGQCPGGRYRMEQLLALLRYQRIDPLPMVTHRFQGFSGIEEAFALMAEKPADLIKPVVLLA